MIRVVLLGASSLVGRFLILRLTVAGYSVEAISRQPAPAALPPSVHWNTLDLASPNAVDRIPDCDLVVTLLPIWMSAALLAQLVDRGVTRAVAFSSTSALTKSDSPNEADRALADRLAQGEEALRQIMPRLGVTIIRPTMIYGGAGDRNVERVAKQLQRLRFFPLVGAGAGLRQPVHADDLAAAVVQIAREPATEGQTYELSGGEVLSFRDMVLRIGSANGVKPRFIRVPLPIAKALLRAASIAPRFRGIPIEALARTEKDMIFSHAMASADFGYRPRPFEPESGEPRPAVT
jgi:uncharacterized protein YbjT (DUF2867 family)